MRTLVSGTGNSFCKAVDAARDINGLIELHRHLTSETAITAVYAKLHYGNLDAEFVCRLAA